MPAGLPVGTTIVSTLVAKVSTSPVTPASSAMPIDASSAVASTSPGAPSAACSARSVLEPNENVTSTSCSSSKARRELARRRR